MSARDDASASFGEHDPAWMPRHLFAGALHLDFASAVRAGISGQRFTVCPRHWYVDATIACADCEKPFGFGVKEQRFWYEELRLFIDSFPNQCPDCRRRRREAATGAAADEP